MSTSELKSRLEVAQGIVNEIEELKEGTPQYQVGGVSVESDI